MIQMRRIWCLCLQIKSKGTRVYTQNTVDKTKNFLKSLLKIFSGLLEELKEDFEWPLREEMQKETQVSASRKMEKTVEIVQKVRERASQLFHANAFHGRTHGFGICRI